MPKSKRHSKRRDRINKRRARRKAQKRALNAKKLQKLIERNLALSAYHSQRKFKQ